MLEAPTPGQPLSKEGEKKEKKEPRPEDKNTADCDVSGYCPVERRKYIPSAEEYANGKDFFP